MQNLLYKYCFTEKENGLLIIDMPTGTGKTYNTLEFIFNNYKKSKNKIIFITNLKKNLPINKFKEFFSKNNQVEDFEKDVLFLDNNVDTLIENFDAVKDLIPKNEYNKNNVYNNVRNNIKIIKTLKETLNKSKSIQNFESIGSVENAYLMINQARESLQERYEKEFREMIEHNLTYDSDGNKRTKKQKLELIKNDSNFQWIKKLYPAVLTDDKKVIFMSVDKFLVRNSSIIEPSYNILDNKNLLKSSIIFIDEFDASKEILLKNIIKESIDTRVSIIELFRVIYAGLENTEFSRLLTQESNYLKEKISLNNGIYYTPEEILSQFKNRAKEIEQKYKLINFHKLDSKDKDNANFLFQDYKFHTILGDSKNIYLDNDQENRITWVKKGENKTLSEENNIFLLLKDIKSFLTYFQNGINLIANNYLYFKQERQLETNNFSFEAAIKTVLSEFGIEGKYLNYLTSQIKNSSKRTSTKIVDLKSELDYSVYEKGFRFYDFVDNETYDTQSKINYLSFNLSPEKVLIYLCSIAKVIGISASGSLETVTGNYDLNYIKKKTGNGFYNISQEDRNRLDSFVQKKIGNYSKINVEIDKCDLTEFNYDEFLQKTFKNKEEYNSIISDLNDLTTEDYVKLRYCKVIYAINKFFEKGIQSFLYITNTTMKLGFDFNSNFIQKIFYILKPENSNAYCFSLEGTLEKFENTKKKISSMLKNGKRLFVVSTYQTLGAGQNLQYEYTDDYQENIETISDEEYSKNFKDFDALFLDKPTNLFVNLNRNPTEEQLLKFIYQVKCLEETGYFSLDKATDEIKKGIKIFYHSSPQKIETPKSRDIFMHTAKVILQAVGRICRTSNKSKNIYICYDNQMEKDLSQVKEELLKRPLNYEFKKLLENCQDEETYKHNLLNNINNSKAEKNNDKINKLKEFNTFNDIVKWEELREIVLKYPFDNCRIHEKYDIYCQLQEPSDHYYFKRTQDKKAYEFTGNFQSDLCVSEDMANLKTLMSIPEIKKYFESCGYATKFDKSCYILLPNVFKRIYLGALGESIGEFLINRILNKYGMKLDRIKILERYEKYDFVFDSDKYIDFKCWTGFSDKDREFEVNRARKKLNQCSGQIGFIINILKPNNCNVLHYASDDGNIVIIPYLYDAETRKWNIDGINYFVNKILNKK